MCNDRDPPWFNTKIRLLIKEKTTAFKYFCQNGNNAYWQHRLKVLQDHVNNSVESSKEKCYNRMASQLQNTKETSKIFWSLLTIFLNNKKIPLIPPLFHMNRFTSDFKRKAKLSDYFFQINVH